MNGITRDGHVSYMQIPAVDVEQSAGFYEKVFGWNIRGGNADHYSFDDATGDFIGAWVTGRAIAKEPGLLPYIHVERIDECLDLVVAHGGEIAEPPCPEGDLWVARFRDPAGNVLGVWHLGPR